MRYKNLREPLTRVFCTTSLLKICWWTVKHEFTGVTIQCCFCSLFHFILLVGDYVNLGKIFIWMNTVALYILLRGSLPKSVPLDFGLEKNFCLIFLSPTLLSIPITKLQLEWGNCLFYCHSQHFIAGRPLAAKICNFRMMLFHRLFNDRLKVLLVIKS